MGLSFFLRVLPGLTVYQRTSFLNMQDSGAQGDFNMANLLQVLHSG